MSYNQQYNNGGGQQGGYQRKSNKIFVGNAYSGQYGLSGHINLSDVEAHPEHIHTGTDGKRYVKVYINRNKMPLPGKADHNIAINTTPPKPQNQQNHAQQTQGGYAPAQGGYAPPQQQGYQQAPPQQAPQQGGYQMPPQAAGAPMGTPPPAPQPEQRQYDDNMVPGNDAPPPF